jgi:hypothetical protein
MVLGFRFVLTIYRSRDMCLNSYACMNNMPAWVFCEGGSINLDLLQYIEASTEHMHLHMLPSIVEWA